MRAIHPECVRLKPCLTGRTFGRRVGRLCRLRRAGVAAVVLMADPARDRLPSVVSDVGISACKMMSKTDLAKRACVLLSQAQWIVREALDAEMMGESVASANRELLGQILELLEDVYLVSGPSGYTSTPEVYFRGSRSFNEESAITVREATTLKGIRDSVELLGMLTSLPEGELLCVSWQRGPDTIEAIVQRVFDQQALEIVEPAQLPGNDALK